MSRRRRSQNEKFNLFCIHIYYRGVGRDRLAKWFFSHIIYYFTTSLSDHHLLGISTIRILNATVRKLSVVKINGLTRNLRRSSNDRLSVCIAVIIYIIWEEWTPRELTRSIPIYFSITYRARSPLFFHSSFQHRFWFFPLYLFIETTSRSSPMLIARG